MKIFKVAALAFFEGEAVGEGVLGIDALDGVGAAADLEGGEAVLGFAGGVEGEAGDDDVGGDVDVHDGWHGLHGADAGVFAYDDEGGVP